MTGALHIRWAWLFLDTPRADAARSRRFWSEVTGWVRSSTKGARDEFATLLPERGDPWVKLQTVDAGVGGIHLGLDVEDVHSAASAAEALGAVHTGSIGDTVVLLRSPGGFPFCLTTWQGERAQVRVGAPDLIDQACLDIPQDRYAVDLAFWVALTGWEWSDLEEPELSCLTAPPGIPFRVLFQRLDEPTGEVRAHADIACADRDVTVARHRRAGAEIVEHRQQWTVMRDPVGRVYCLTDRKPIVAGTGGARAPSPERATVHPRSP